MSTSPAYAAEPWMPLGPAARGWEHTHVEGETTAPATKSALHRGGREGLSPKSDDMAREAGARGPRGEAAHVEEPELQAGPKEGAPRLSEVHAWGVEEGWGKKAGRWGKGASVYRRE